MIPEASSSCPPPGSPPSRPPADTAFAEGTFLLREAVDRGYGSGVFRHERWYRPFPGLRSKAPLAGNLRDRALQYLPRLRPGEHFSHATALALLGCPIRVRAHAPVDVASPKSLGWIHCRGISGHQYRSEPELYPCAIPGYEERIPVTRPLRAVQEAAVQLPFPELVVALDHLLLDDPKRYDRWLRISPEQLSQAAASARGRGAARFRAAAELARVGAESRMETLMRLCAVRAGMPELHLQLELYDAAGVWIGRFDAVDRRTRSVYEYDGEQHHYSRKQRRRDPRKLQHAHDAGWRVMVLYAEDVAGTPLSTGRRMLAFSGNLPQRVPAGLARLLDERAEGPTESAVPYRNARQAFVAG